MSVEEDWLGLAPADVSQVSMNLWMGACPIGTAPAKFDYIVALYDGELPYRLCPHQLRTVAHMVDCEFLPERALLESLAALVNWYRARGATLIHCQAGLNRSGIVAALALMRAGDTAPQAIAQLRARRHATVLCNPWFEQWLREKA